jgi:hypothetical protein
MAQAEACEADENRTLGDVQAAFIAEQQAALQAGQEALAKQQADAEALAKVPATARGVDGVDASGGGDEGETSESDPVEAYEASVAKYMKRGKTRPEACRMVAKEEPETNMAYVEAHNKKHGGKMRDVRVLKEAHGV